MRRSRSRPARSLGAAWSPRPLRPRTATAGPYRLRRRRRAGWTRTRSRADLSSSVSSLVLPARLPARERALDPLQREIQDQRQDGDDDDTSEHPSRVEECLRRRDPPAQSGVGADVFGDDRAREGEAGAGPQARNDRAEGCREQHLEGHVAAPGPEHADVVHERLVDVAHRGEVAKKTMKNTSVTPSATLLARSMPNARMKTGARTRRGIALNIERSGSNACPRRRLRANA